MAVSWKDIYISWFGSQAKNVRFKRGVETAMFGDAKVHLPDLRSSIGISSK